MIPQSGGRGDFGSVHAEELCDRFELTASRVAHGKIGRHLMDENVGVPRIAGPRQDPGDVRQITVDPAGQLRVPDTEVLQEIIQISKKNVMIHTKQILHGIPQSLIDFFKGTDRDLLFFREICECAGKVFEFFAIISGLPFSGTEPADRCRAQAGAFRQLFLRGRDRMKIGT